MINIVLSLSLFKTKTKRKQLDEYAVRRRRFPDAARTSGRRAFFLRPKRQPKSRLFFSLRAFDETF